MLVHSISNQDLNTIRMNRIQHKSEVKNKEFGTQNTNTSELPSYSAAGSYANISFKGWDELLIAVNYDDVETLRKELEKGTNINARNYFGKTAIIMAGDNGSTKCFKELRKHPELDIYAEDNNGWMCFTNACFCNHKDIIQDLCDDKNFDINYQSIKTGDNGLIVACRNGKEEAVDIILERDDVDLTLRNKENQSAFDCAKKYPSILKKLQNYEAKQKERAEQKKTEQTQAEQKYPDKSEVYARAKEMGYDIDKMNNYELKSYYHGEFLSTTNDYGHTRLIQAFLIGDKEEFDRLLNDPHTDINEKESSRFTFLEGLYIWLDTQSRNCLYYAEKLLQHPGVDTSSYFAHVKQHDYNTEHKDLRKLDSMVRSYQRGVDKRTKSIALTETKEVQKELTPEEKIQKLLTYKDIWTDDEKSKVEKLIKDKNYAELASLLVSKGDTINDAYGNAEKIIAEVTENTKKEVRKTETAQIRQEEQKKAEKALEEREQNLRIAEANLETEKSRLNEKIKSETERAVKKEKEELEKQKTDLKQQLDAVQKKEETFNNLIDKSQTIIDRGIEDAKMGFRVFYGIEVEELPEIMGLREQITFVTTKLAENKNKLTNIDKDTPKKVTKALQNKKEQISADGIKFLERFLSVSESQCSEEDLINSIKAVKDKIGNIDMGKASQFIADLSWGFSSINDIINDVRLGVKI